MRNWYTVGTIILPLVTFRALIYREKRLEMKNNLMCWYELHTFVAKTAKLDTFFTFTTVVTPLILLVASRTLIIYGLELLITRTLLSKK